MGVVLTPKAAAGWRGRGAPRREVSDRVMQLLAATYRTGNVGTINLFDDDLDENQIRELLLQLKAGARHQGRRLRVQYDESVIRFEMVDQAQRKAAA